jgi:hypothetical protein
MLFLLDSVPSPLTSLPSLYPGIPPKGRYHRSSPRAGAELAPTKSSVGNPPASWSWPRQEYPSLHSIPYNLPAVPEVPLVSPRSASIARPRPCCCFYRRGEDGLHAALSRLTRGRLGADPGQSMLVPSRSGLVLLHQARIDPARQFFFIIKPLFIFS